MRRFLIVGALAVLLPGSRDEASAQVNCLALSGSCSTSSTGTVISITVARAIALDLSPATTSLVAPTATHYNAGYAQTSGPTLTVRANTPWSVAISSSTAVWSATNTQSEPARVNKPASDLRWATSVGGPFTAMGMTPATLASGNATASTVRTLFFRTSYSWTLDTPGNYSIQLVLTVTAP